MRNKTKMVNEMSGKRSPKINQKTDQKKSKRLAVEKKKIVQKPKPIESQKENKKMKLALPIELREKINAEKDPGAGRMCRFKKKSTTILSKFSAVTFRI